LARQKGQDLLVAEWERNPPDNTELVLVGPGDDTALRSLAPREWGRSIRAVGESDDIRPWLWASDALVLSSRYETVAVVIAEAMACGLPVIATDVNGAREVLQGGGSTRAGEVIPVGDMTALLATADRIVTSPRDRAEMAAAGRARAERLFTAASVVDRLDTAYRAAVQSRAPHARLRSPNRVHVT
jgi:glycosyltransferase involved in cell wall biosynthesis